MKVTEGLPETDYHAIDRASQSTLKRLLPPDELSPAALRYQMLNPTSSTAAQKVGSALHAILFGDEPLPYEIGPTKTRNSNAWRDMQADKPNVTLLTGDELDLAVLMSESIKCHKAANELLMRPGREELTLEWSQQTGDIVCPCKARFDRVVDDPPLIIDVKTTDNVSPSAFQKSITKWGYHYQAGFYLEAAEQASIEALHYVWIVVSKTPPHEVAVYKFDQAAAWASWEQLAAPLNTMAQCYATDEWPTHPQEINDIGLPEWANIQLAGGVA